MLNCVPRKTSCPTYSISLRAFIFYVPSFFTCLTSVQFLRALYVFLFNVTYAPSFFTWFMCFHFLGALYVLRFFTYLTCPIFFYVPYVPSVFLSALSALIFLSVLHVSTFLHDMWNNPNSPTPASWNKQERGRIK